MGYLIIMMVVLTGGCLVLGCINYKINKLKEENKLNIETIGSIIALEKAMKKLNAALRTESRRLRSLEKRVDIIESGHPNSEFDYAITDDHDNIVEVWVDGKKYILEDKPDEDVMKLYADNKVMAETTRPDVKCCATCQYYRPGPDHTCTIRPWLHVTKKYATMADSACNSYEKASTPCVSSDKGEVEYSYTTYKDMGGNARTEQLTKLTENLNYFYNGGLMSMATYRNMMEERMQNDS